MMMDENNSREIDQLIDLECGTEAILNDDISPCNEQRMMVCYNEWSYCLGIDGLLRGEEALSSGNDSTPSSLKLPISHEEGLGGKIISGLENSGISVKVGKGKPKKKSRKKPPKPPQSSRSLPLDDTDQKLVKELAEIAALRQARIERMKKKLKNIKPTSHNSSWWPLIITVLFFLIVIWQGFSSQGRSNINFHGSPESSVQTGGGLITLEFYRNISRNYPQVSTSESSNTAAALSNQT